MKKWLLVLAFCTFLVVTTSSCNEPAKSKELIIYNNSSYSINFLGVGQTVSGARDLGFANILDEGETIAPGTTLTINIVPYVSTSQLYINDTEENGSTTYFTYEYLVGEINEAITATYTDQGVSLSGSNVVVLNEGN